jgi:hypothetical protein
MRFFCARVGSLSIGSSNLKNSLLDAVDTPLSSRLFFKLELPILREPTLAQTILTLEKAGAKLTGTQFRLRKNFGA